MVGGNMQVGDKVSFRTDGPLKFKSARYYALRYPKINTVLEVRGDVCRITGNIFFEDATQWHDQDHLHIVEDT